MLVPTDVFDRMVDVRRDLHQHPELGWEERRTATVIETALSDLGLACRTGVAGTGVIADLPGDRDAPLMALRADTDALPISEQTSLPFASRNQAIMHACGHDAHVAMLIGAAALLLRSHDQHGPIRLLFQPAEELGTGAPEMIRAGALEGVASIFGGHVDTQYEPGEIVVHEGSVNASTDEFAVEFSGPGGHAARPHESADPIVAASDLVSALQTLVSRRVPPDQPAVLTVGRIEGGTASNILACRVRLDGTLRALTPEVREHLQDGIRELAATTGAKHRTEVTTQFLAGTPPVFNQAQPLATCRRAAINTVGEAKVLPLRAPNMGGEDFGYYLEQVPGCYVRFGARRSDLSAGPAHSPRFDIDESVLAVGARYYSEVAVEAGG